MLRVTGARALVLQPGVASCLLPHTLQVSSSSWTADTLASRGFIPLPLSLSVSYSSLLLSLSLDTSAREMLISSTSGPSPSPSPSPPTTLASSEETVSTAAPAAGGANDDSTTGQRVCACMLAARWGAMEMAIAGSLCTRVSGERCCCWRGGPLSGAQLLAEVSHAASRYVSREFPLQETEQWQNRGVSVMTYLRGVYGTETQSSQGPGTSRQ